MLGSIPAATVSALRAFEPNNKKHHTADRNIALLGANEMRRLYSHRVATATGGIERIESRFQIDQQGRTVIPVSGGMLASRR